MYLNCIFNVAKKIIQRSKGKLLAETPFAVTGRFQLTSQKVEFKDRNTLNVVILTTFLEEESMTFLAI